MNDTSIKLIRLGMQLLESQTGIPIEVDISGKWFTDRLSESTLPDCFVSDLALMGIPIVETGLGTFGILNKVPDTFKTAYSIAAKATMLGATVSVQTVEASDGKVLH